MLNEENLDKSLPKVNDLQTQSKTAVLMEFLINVSTAVVIFLGIYFFVAQPHQVDGNSMLPTYHSGDYVLTEKITQRFSGIKHGDVVVFNYPKNPNYDYIKRVIALPGDKIMIKNGDVYLNGVSLAEDYLIKPNRNIALAKEDEKITTTGHSFLSEGEEYMVEANEVIVMGDNRNESSDSREWGPVKSSEVVGKVFFRYWPISRVGLLSH